MLHIRARRTDKKGEAREEEGEGGDMRREAREVENTTPIYSPYRPKDIAPP